jgi:hypothetical protein
MAAGASDRSQPENISPPNGITSLPTFYSLIALCGRLSSRNHEIRPLSFWQSHAQNATDGAFKRNILGESVPLPELRGTRKNMLWCSPLSRLQQPIPSVISITLDPHHGC